jgi:hypothetical protein
MIRYGKWSKMGLQTKIFFFLMMLLACNLFYLSSTDLHWKISCFNQCCGSMQFWYGYGSGSVDPCLWLMDPDADPESSIFVSDLTSKNAFCTPSKKYSSRDTIPLTDTFVTQNRKNRKWWTMYYKQSGEGHIICLSVIVGLHKCPGIFRLCFVLLI